MSQALINQSNLISDVDQLVRSVLSCPFSFEDIRNRLNTLYHPFMYHFDHELFYSQTIDAFVYSTIPIVGDSTLLMSLGIMIRPNSLLAPCHTIGVRLSLKIRLGIIRKLRTEKTSTPTFAI